MGNQLTSSSQCVQDAYSTVIEAGFTPMSFSDYIRLGGTIIQHGEIQITDTVTVGVCPIYGCYVTRKLRSGSTSVGAFTKNRNELIGDIRCTLSIAIAEHDQIQKSL